MLIFTRVHIEIGTLAWQIIPVCYIPKIFQININCVTTNPKIKIYLQNVTSEQ